jgi:hypothetical protein
MAQSTFNSTGENEMNVYVYNAALYCATCGEYHVNRLRFSKVADTGDSDDYPQGPYGDGGGEADCPQHCDNCGCFLENPLTSDGRIYVREALEEHANHGRGDPLVLGEWEEFYQLDRIA